MKIKKILRNPSIIVDFLNNKGLFKNVSDKRFLEWQYRRKMGRHLNLNNPKTYNEKLQWLKLNDRNPLYTKLVDKYSVREYVSKKLGEKYLIPLYGVWDSVEQIEWNRLPDQFVLKTTHDSGGVVICNDKSTFDYRSAQKKLKRHLSQNYYYPGREWPYKDVKPRIIAEKYMVDQSGNELKDYKFFCFNGEPKLMFIASNRSIEPKFDFFDLNFNRLPIKQKYKNSKTKKIEKPDNFQEMIEVSAVLSKDLPHVRVDFYNINGQIYFGEMTFYHFSGFEKFNPEKYDEILGDWITLV